jgi:D-beta-D-heptose 7-phosphate kinase/D-beta-D-heptose 1-phosphate adenosyltransferase
MNETNSSYLPSNVTELDMNKRWVLTTGVFHLVHPGHVELFEYCSTLGSVIVGINSDDYVTQKAGKIIIPLHERIYMLKSIRFVDHVFVFSEPNPCELIKRLRPQIFVKGPDYKDILTPELEVCKEMKIQYLVAPQTKKFNSRDLL